MSEPDHTSSQGDMLEMFLSDKYQPSDVLNMALSKHHSFKRS